MPERTLAKLGQAPAMRGRAPATPAQPQAPPKAATATPETAPATPAPILVIACGALAREIEALRRRWGWNHLHLKCLPAELHNRPAEIPGRLRRMIRKHRTDYEEIFVAYADCGTAGGIDRVLAEEGAGRLEGAHCYEFFAGRDRFAELALAEPGTFYLTDFLARHFDRFVIKPLGLDRHPQLRDAYFGHYRKLVYLSQTQDERLLDSAARAAQRLGLDFEHVRCGYGGLAAGLAARFGSGIPKSDAARPGAGASEYRKARPGFGIPENGQESPRLLA